MKKLLDNILIVEDEPLIAEDISDILQEAGYGIAGIAHNANDAIKILKTNAPALTLLDINIDGEIDGLMLAGIINEKFNIPFIFLTSYTDKPTLAKIAELKASGYITKPFNDSQLVTNIALGIERYKESSADLSSLEEKEETPKHFFIKKDSRLVKINVEDILYAQAFDNYTYLITSSEKYLVPNTLKKISEKINNQDFLRIHRSYVVNLRKIEEISDEGVVLKKGKTLPVSRSAKSELMKRVELL